jgi:hypothetical protein
MFNENLERALGNIDLSTDKSSWSRFCEWLSSFHDLDVYRLSEFNTFSEFEEDGEIRLPLKYFEKIKDLWIKWSRAVESDIVAKASI